MRASTTLTRLSVAVATGTGLMLAALPAAAVTLPASSVSFSSLVVMGDSLSDSGRLYAMTGGTFPPAPYYQGRFSDGPVAVEALASSLGLGGTHYNNLAIAGARTGLSGSADVNIGRATGMLTQLAGYQASLAGGAADSNALYFVWGGANDMRDAFVASAGGDAGAINAGIATAIGNLTTIVSTLHGLGATKFFLPNLPDIGLTPEARANGAGASAGASFVSGIFNQNLSAAYASLAAQWSDETFYYFDAMRAQRAITNGAPGNGFSNVSEACFDNPGAPVVPTLCGAPAGYLYWDNIHPTAAAHAVLGNQMLAAVPEPQTMLMMAVGLLGLLAATRRRQA